MGVKPGESLSFSLAYLSHRSQQPTGRSHVPPVAVRVAKVLVVAIVIERVHQVQDGLHPRHLLGRLIRVVGVAGTLRGLVVA